MVKMFPEVNVHFKAQADSLSNPTGNSLLFIRQARMLPGQVNSGFGLLQMKRR
jgi:hypothetical protein